MGGIQWPLMTPSTSKKHTEFHEWMVHSVFLTSKNQKNISTWERLREPIGWFKQPPHSYWPTGTNYFTDWWDNFTWAKGGISNHHFRRPNLQCFALSMYPRSNQNIPKHVLKLLLWIHVDVEEISSKNQKVYAFFHRIPTAQQSFFCPPNKVAQKPKAMWFFY